MSKSKAIYFEPVMVRIESLAPGRLEKIVWGEKKKKEKGRKKNTRQSPTLKTERSEGSFLAIRGRYFNSVRLEFIAVSVIAQFYREILIKRNTEVLCNQVS